MRTISTWQPFASLLASQSKRHETRGWPTDYRGPLAIHAAAKRDSYCANLIYQEPFKTAMRLSGFDRFADLPFGAVVAIGNLAACHPTDDLRQRISDQELEFGDWTEGRFAWEFDRVLLLPKPVPAKGAQKLWDWRPDEETRKLIDEWRAAV